MLSRDGKKILCDVLGCGNEAVGGCELRIKASHDGNPNTIPGDLVSWCEVDEESLRRGLQDEFIPLTVAELRARYLKPPN
jgi:hypothetical protein